MRHAIRFDEIAHRLERTAFVRRRCAGVEAVRHQAPPAAIPENVCQAMRKHARGHASGVHGIVPRAHGIREERRDVALVNTNFSAWPKVLLRCEPVCVVACQRVTLVAHQLRVRPAGRDLGLPEERGNIGVKLQLKCHCESERAGVPWCERVSVSVETDVDS